MLCRSIQALLGFLLVIGTSASAFADSSSFTNLRVSPVGFLVGSYSVDLDFVVAPDWTIGPTLSYSFQKVDSSNQNFSKFDVNAYSLGARANWFSNGVFSDGWYVGPSLTYTSAKVSTKDNFGHQYDVNANAPVLAVIGGYGWFWENFNIMLGLGINAALGDIKVTVSDQSGNQASNTSTGAGLTGEFSFGWTF